MKSGPDVFADALVPRDVSLSPKRLAFPGTVSRSDCLALKAAWHLDISRSFARLSWSPPVPPGHCIVAVMRHAGWNVARFANPSPGLFRIPNPPLRHRRRT
jgi:hypothetical protein